MERADSSTIHITDEEEECNDTENHSFTHNTPVVKSAE